MNRMIENVERERIAKGRTPRSAAKMFSFTPSRRRRSFSLRVFFFFFSSSSSLLFLSPSTTAEDEKSLGRAALDANDERCPFDKIYDRRSADGRFHQPSSPRARATETIPRAKSGVELRDAHAIASAPGAIAAHCFHPASAIARSPRRVAIPVRTNPNQSVPLSSAASRKLQAGFAPRFELVSLEVGRRTDGFFAPRGRRDARGRDVPGMCLARRRVTRARASSRCRNLSS